VKIKPQAVRELSVAIGGDVSREHAIAVLRKAASHATRATTRFKKEAHNRGLFRQKPYNELWVHDWLYIIVTKDSDRLAIRSCFRMTM